MAYRRFKLPELPSTPATLATVATVQAEQGQNVATVATVAGPEAKSLPLDHSPSVASVASVAGGKPDCGNWDEEDWRAFFDERAAMAEFDGGQSREEAEALAHACCVAEWLNRNPVRSSSSHCLQCGCGEHLGRPLLPFGGDALGHAWLHADCWEEWRASRQAEARSELAALGIFEPGGET
jgi:hypothetical protein